MLVLSTANTTTTMKAGSYRWSKYETRSKQRLQKVHQKIKEVALELDAIAKEDFEYTKQHLSPTEQVVEIVESSQSSSSLFDP